jgi:hypothetical protein
MKVLIGILIALIVALGAYKIYEHWTYVSEQNSLEQKATAGPDVDPRRLPGLPWQLDAKLSEAQQAGPEAFKRFVEQLRKYPDVKDPRLAWIELDYVVLISSTDPLKAKQIFYDVKKRTPEDSPIYPRIRQLSKTYD